MRLLLAAALLTTSACSQTAGGGDVGQENAPAPTTDTSVVSVETATSTQEAWGTFRQYFAGDTPRSKDLLSGTATIKPGMEIHPPHKHAEEEFLMVISGAGEWTVGEETFAAETGDMLYSKAWDLHGIKNTGDEPLTFVFWKWNSKGIEVPADPAE